MKEEQAIEEIFNGDEYGLLESDTCWEGLDEIR